MNCYDNTDNLDKIAAIKPIVVMTVDEYTSFQEASFKKDTQISILKGQLQAYMDTLRDVERELNNLRLENQDLKHLKQYERLKKIKAEAKKWKVFADEYRQERDEYKKKMRNLERSLCYTKDTLKKVREGIIK